MYSVGAYRVQRILGAFLMLDTGIAVCYPGPPVVHRFVTISAGARNRTTLYICGTDEYGTATERQAKKEKRSEEALCKEYHDLHKETYDWFDIGYLSRIPMPQSY
jgi:hypothetical protein